VTKAKVVTKAKAKRPGKRVGTRTPVVKPAPAESIRVDCAPESPPATAIAPAPAPPAAAIDLAPTPAAAAVDPAPPQTAACQRATVVLDSSLQIKDVEEAHRRLLAAVAGAPSLAVDVSRIESIDTAGIQVLLAVQKSAAAHGVPVEFCGESAALSQALATLGLSAAFQFVIPHA
jgi:anti-sigma B factor antagonist